MKRGSAAVSGRYRYRCCGNVVVAAAAASMLSLRCSETWTVSVPVAASEENSGHHGFRYRRTETFARMGNVGMERIASADGCIYPATAP